VNNNFGRICIEGAVAYFEVLSQHLPGYTEEYYKYLIRVDGVRAERIVKNSNRGAGRIFGVWLAETE
jgi:hypothetical protein